ncbi:MAG: hypothetical protein H7319_10825 [Spirosoma sp.]|nr:hypothetical protein [Spirosoma sp.]
MADKILVYTSVERVWDIDGHPNYFFGDDKHLYRYDSRGRVRRNKQIVVGYTMGYVLKSKFFSLVRLRSMLRRHGPAPHQAGF